MLFNRKTRKNEENVFSSFFCCISLSLSDLVSMSRALKTLSEVARFWFGEKFYDLSIPQRNSIPLIQDRIGVWFRRADPNFETIQLESKDLIDKFALEQDQGVVVGNYSPQEVLGKIILFDQFSRSIHRGTPLAFYYDKYANACVKALHENGWYPKEYSAIERLFITLSFQHSEDMSLQEIGKNMAYTITDDFDDEAIKDHFKNMPGFLTEHYDVVKRFGRFPSRNEALGRETTAEELEWLNSPDCPAWAKSQLKKKPEVDDNKK